MTSQENIDLTIRHDENADTSVGVSFSGGGIRSAAFSSGILRRMLHKSVPVDYLSCVSGGGFTGTAYLEWKYRNGGIDDAVWHEKFFNQMRKNASTLCIWRNPINGFFNSLSVVLLITMVGIVIPSLIWVPIAFAAAYIVDLAFGNVLRSGFTCKDNPLFNVTKLNATTDPNRYRRVDNAYCLVDRTKGPDALLIFFGSFLLATIFFFCLYKISSKKWQPFFYIPVSLLAILLAFLFLPWFFEMYMPMIPVWLKAVVLTLGVVLWMGIPPLRSKASWSLLLYFYAYVIRWRVYKNPILKIQYNEKTFMFILWACTLCFLLSPFLSIVQQCTIHAFYRCKLQSAFYTARSAGCLGCAGISFSDFFDIGDNRQRSSYKTIEDPGCTKETITLGDLSGIKPYYICNVLVDNWTYKSLVRPSDSYTILTLSPHLIERIDDDDEKDFDENFIQPEDVELSDAMATSAAVVSNHMGGYKNDAFLSLQTLLGLTMGKSWVSDRRFLKKTMCGHCTPFMLQALLGLPLLLVPLFDIFFKQHDVIRHVLVSVFIGCLLIVITISLMHTGSSSKSKIENFVRWCIINVYQVRYIRETLGIPNIGEVPPAILYLSDGGHVENLGLLALLKRRLRRIIVADGGFCSSKAEVAEALLVSLKLAREKLYCSFNGLDGRDIEEDIRENFVEQLNGEYTRNYTFKVGYYERNTKTNRTIKVGEGQIMILTPRHPHEGIPYPKDPTWSSYEQDTGVQLKRKNWGQGPVLSSEEVDKLTLACSECCHCGCYRCCSDPICGSFPYHVTANQFFTGSLFSAYHREGYRAAMQAGIEDFVVLDKE